MIDVVYKPKTLEKALDILESKPNVMIIAGGMDLIVQIKNGRLNKDALVDISNLNELKKIKEEANVIKIGSGVTFSDIIECEKFEKNLYGLKKAASLISSSQIINKGTIGGNIFNNSTIANLLPPLLALDAKVEIQSKANKRKEYLKDILLKENKVDIKENEILTYIEFENLKYNQMLSFSKLHFMHSKDIYKVSSSVLLDIKDNKFENINIALSEFGILENIKDDLKNCLIGKEVNENNSIHVLKVIEKNISDESNTSFKSEAIKAVLYNALKECINSY